MKGTNRVDTMTTVGEILGEGNTYPFISLSWGGRNESAGEIGKRLRETLDVVAALFQEDPVKWYHDVPKVQPKLDLVPEDGSELADFIDASFHRIWGESPAWTTLSLVLKDRPTQGARGLADMHVMAGSSMERQNAVTLQMPDDFPAGSPSKMGWLLLTLVRIWQPDFAKFTSSSVQEAQKPPFTHAAYLAWQSPKVYGPEPETDLELRVPWGDGVLYAAREWTIPGLVELNKHLAAAGARTSTKSPELQSPPQFPDDYPPGLKDLDDNIAYGAGAASSER